MKRLITGCKLISVGLSYNCKDITIHIEHFTCRCNKSNKHRRNLHNFVLQEMFPPATATRRKSSTITPLKFSCLLIEVVKLDIHSYVTLILSSDVTIQDWQ